MYQKYHTEALVLRSYERGEADRMYALFTRNFGLVWARAAAVRREGSRMRCALQSGAYTRVSLVRGTRGWRIAGALAEAERISSLPGTHAFARMTQLLERLSGGEEANPFLFETLASAREALAEEGESEHSLIELVCVARMLHALGYLSKEALGSALFLETAFATSTLHEAKEKRSEILSSINKALSESQL